MTNTTHPETARQHDTTISHTIGVTTGFILAYLLFTTILTVMTGLRGAYQPITAISITTTATITGATLNHIL